MELEEKRELEKKVNRWKPNIGMYLICMLPIILGIIFIINLSIGLKKDFDDNYIKEKCRIENKNIQNNTISFDVKYGCSDKWCYYGIITIKGSQHKINKLDQKYLINNTYNCWVDWHAKYDRVKFNLQDLDVDYTIYIVITCIIIFMFVVLVLLPIIYIFIVTLYYYKLKYDYKKYEEFEGDEMIDITSL